MSVIEIEQDSMVDTQVLIWDVAPQPQRTTTACFNP